MPPTIYDIAKKAKVGIGTVSRVFNNHPSVSKETKHRVLRVADRLKYQPHAYARGLASKRTNSILAVIPYFTTFFFVKLLQSVQSTLAESGCDLILHGLTDPEHAEGALLKNTLRGRVDGMLIFSIKVPDAFVREYATSRVPVVLVDTYHPDFDSFRVENIQGAVIATEHLISLGHKRIGLLNANVRSLPARERLSGFLRAMKENKMDVDPRLVKSSTSTSFDGFTRECGHDLMKEFLQLGSDRPTAVFVCSDIQASGALWAIDEAGLRCPEDIAIVGFDDIELAYHLRMTTIHQPIFEMGVLAARKIEERINGSQLPPANVPFVPELVIRESCGSRHHRPHVQQAQVLT